MVPAPLTILDSDVSRAFPVSDAALGSIVYAIEALMGYMGGTDRWRTMPLQVVTATSRSFRANSSGHH
ncbi:MAG: hypothetical protein ACRDGB_13805 [Candidatus Limnocylindria bacterium]